MRPHVSGTEHVGFSNQDACGNLVVASLPLNFPFSAFLLKVFAVNLHWTEQDSYLSFSQISSSWRFLALAKLRSKARVWNHQRISKLVNRVDCRLSSDSFLALRSKAIVLASSLRMLHSRILNVPMPYMAFVACQMTALLRFAHAIVRTFLAMHTSQQELHCA